jgi:hypothetical protein
VERHAAPRLDPGKASRPFTNLVIDNIGRTVAHDVRFRFDPPIRTSMDDHGALGDSPLVREGMPTMAPGQRIEALFDFGPDRAETDLPDRYNVTVTLKDALPVRASRRMCCGVHPLRRSGRKPLALMTRRCRHTGRRSIRQVP